MQVLHAQSLIAMLLGLVVVSAENAGRAEFSTSVSAPAGTECENIVQEVRSAVEKDPANVLMIVEDALVIHESCAGKIIRVAIEAAKANAAQVNDIVQAAIAVVPQQAVVITEAAKAVAPHAEITHKDWYKAVAKNQVMQTSVGVFPEPARKRDAITKLKEEAEIAEGEVEAEAPATGRDALDLVSTSDLKGKAWEAIYRFNPSGNAQAPRASGNSGKNPVGKNPVGKEAYSILPDDEEEADGEGDMSSPTYFASSVPSSIRGMYLLQPTPVITPPRKGDSTAISPSTALAKN